MKKSKVEFQSTSTCLSCWGNTQALESPRLIRQYQNYSLVSLKSDYKKLSLKKTLVHKFNQQQNSTGRQQTYKPNSSVQYTNKLNNPNSARQFPQPSIRPLIFTPQLIIKKTAPNQKVNYKGYEQPPIQQNFPQRIIQKNNAKKYIDFKIQKNYSKQLYQTTKYDHDKSISSDILTKTRKPFPHQRPISHLVQLNKSICKSQIQSQSVKERLQESQILVNFFHPDESKILQVQNYLQQNNTVKKLLIESKKD